MRASLSPLLVALLISPAVAEISLTVYSSADPAGFNPQQFIAQQRAGYNPNSAQQVPGFGVVRDVRSIDFKQGTSTLSFTDVAQFIDPTTVSFTDLTAPDATSVLEQQFLFDLVSPEKLLEKYIDQTITVRLPMGDGPVETVTGKLLSSNQGQLVLQTNNGLRMFSRGLGQVQLGEVPGGLITRPTLEWLISSKRPGKRTIRTAYQTAGLTWKADYNLVVNEDDTAASLGAWVTLINLSGASYPDAQLKLIAGDVQRIQQQPRLQQLGFARKAAMEADAAGFEEKSFYEYHLYTLPRKTTVAQNTTQQIALFPTVEQVKIEKVLAYDGQPQAQYWNWGSPQTNKALGNDSNKKVEVYLRFDNKENNRLGIPMPRGKVRVYKQDPADNTLEFVGEDLIDHTPKNQTVLIKTGNAFDVTGERTQTDFTIDNRAHRMTESFKIELSNAKDKPVKVLIVERLYRWTNWEITKQTDDHKKIDARTMHYEVTVPAEGKKTVEYTVLYTW